MRQLLLLFKRDIDKLEYDPGTQYRFHFVAAWAWFLGMIVVPFFDHPHNGTGWVALAILEASLWANFATHFGAMSAALAAKASSEPPTRKDILEAVTERDIIVPEGPQNSATIAAEIDSGLLE